MSKKLVKNHPTLLIFDNFKAQCTKDLLIFLDDKNIHVVLIPANCTDKLQLLDLSVNNYTDGSWNCQLEAGMEAGIIAWKLGMEVGNVAMEAGIVAWNGSWNCKLFKYRLMDLHIIP